MSVSEHSGQANDIRETWAQRSFSRFSLLASAFVERLCVDWWTHRPMLVRITAHVSVAGLALAVLLAGQLKPPAQALGGPSLEATAPQPADVVEEECQAWQPVPSPALTRLALPHTTIPERPRSSVITYTVRSGDTVFGIAQAFGLTPHTIYWANSDVLHDNPHMLWPDTVLNILPVNGVYHAVSAGETIASVAGEYNVDSAVLLNEWNGLDEDRPLQAGSHLVIPGGTREFLVWQLPQFSDLRGSAAAGAGLCALPSVGLRGNGWFNWPTASRRVSGWVFQDSRNPPHAGVDIGLATGDSIYAADNGVVAYAGWNDWGYGYLIVLDHGNGFHTYYGHLSAIWIVCGQSVSQGDAIGAGGSTGRSSGPHLHFEVRYEGIPQDPIYYLP
jgi:murein DD-endopeptidase MepM/ murein hydrolase activator NlpD